LAPDKSKSGQRVYTEKELGLIRRIKGLLYEEGYTIAGAKKRLEVELQDADGDSGTTGTRTAGDADSLTVEVVEAEAEDRGVESAAVVDNALAERIESLQEGLGKALEEVRKLLHIVEEETSD